MLKLYQELINCNSKPKRGSSNYCHARCRWKLLFLNQQTHSCDSHFFCVWANWRTFWGSRTHRLPV